MAISLDNIIKGQVHKPPRLCVYGVQGIGKSTFASQAPDPIFICTEDGLGNIDTNSFPLAKSFDDVMEAITILYTDKHKYGTLVVDSLDWLEPLIWAATAKEHKQDNIESFGYGKGYVFALDQWRKFFDGINALRNDRNMAVVLLAHEQIKRFDSPEIEPYDRYEIKLHKGAAAVTQEWADAILFANYKTHIAKTDVGFNNQKSRGVGKGERVLYTQEMPAYRAKNRYGLPASIPFSWSALIDAMTAANELKQAS